MRKNTSISLGDYYETFIEEQVNRGRFGSRSEAVRAGLRLLVERETKLEALQRALVEGEQSGASDYSLKGLLAELDREGTA